MSQRTGFGTYVAGQMTELETRSVLSRDGDIGTWAQDFGLALPKNTPSHPVNWMDAGANELRKDYRFNKTLVRAHNIRGHSCLLSCFTLKEEYR